MKEDMIFSALQAGKLQLLRYLWCDNSNVVRAKSLYLPTFREGHAMDDDKALLSALAQTVTITAAMQSVPATRDAPAPTAGLAPVHDIRLVPAWDAFALTADSPDIALVLTAMYEGDTPWMHCPRSFLKRMVARLAAQKLELHIGLELEFYLLQPPVAPGEPPRPIDRSVYARSLAAHGSRAVIGDILDALRRQSIPVEQTLAEGGPGQQEITLQHCGPLQLADRLILARETIHHVANEHGLLASFLPVVFEGAAGSGLHTHFSLWDRRGNISADASQPYGLEARSNAFMAGVLAHLPALMAVTTPSRNSYRRIQPHAWSGAYQAWGLENKEAALRVILNPLSGAPTNIELKTMDGAANPFLALGCLLAAGLDGLQRELRLPEPVAVDPGNLSEDERDSLNIARLPQTAVSALQYFVDDDVLQEALGPEAARVFAAVRRAELADLAELSFEQERDLLLQRY